MLLLLFVHVYITCTEANVIFFVVVCDPPPAAPRNGTSNSADVSPTGVFLECDEIMYSCIDPLFGIAGGINTAMCGSSGAWTPDIINVCEQMCECFPFKNLLFIV